MSDINRRIGKLDDHFGEKGCSTCERWRRTEVQIGSAAELGAAPPPAPARCPSCGRAVPKMTTLVRIMAPDDAENAEVLS